MATATAKVQKRLAAMKELARIASVMVDGEEALRVITDRAMHYIANPDPKHRFMTGDYFDVNFEPSLRTKKTLLRLQQLADFRCDNVFWLRVKGRDDLVTCLTHNGTLSRWYQFGGSSVKVEGALAKCLEAGTVVAADCRDPSKPLTVLAPVRDSLGDVVGAVELSAPHPASRTLAPAWN